jgi:hypothetical protein
MRPPDVLQRFGQHHRIMLRKPLGEEQIGHPDAEAFTVVSEQGGGFEPGVEAVTADLGLNPAENLVPNR